MAYVILGLLLIYRMSLYDLIRAFEAGPSLFYSASAGSIKRAIDSLLRDGRIEVDNVEAGGRGRKTYRITASGEEYFREWMLSEICGSDAESAALARLYFLGLLPKEDKGQVLDNIDQGLGESLQKLRDVEAEIVHAEIPEHLREVAIYQRATLAYGLASHEFALEWFRKNLR